MKKILLSLTLTITLALFSLMSARAEGGQFTISSPRTTYNVGDEITTTYSVDAGEYASTLSTIDFEVKVSDPSIIQPSSADNPFIAGTIFSQTAIQSVQDDIINVVAHINPESKPSSRSGEIGTIKFRALKAGTVTLSYNSIQAAEENLEDQYITTTAGSLTLTIGSGSSTTAASTSTGSTTARVVATATPRPVAVATTARTGPESAVAFALGGGILIFLSLRRLKGNKL